MKYTGIIRKIDELGRIVIPKEIRNVLHIKSNDDLEFLIEDNHIILCKDNNDDLKTISNDILESTKGLVSGIVLIADKEKIITYGDFLDESIPLVCQRLINDRKEYISTDKETYILNNTTLCGYTIFTPLVRDSNPIGIIMYISTDKVSDMEILYCHMLKNIIENK